MSDPGKPRKYSDPPKGHRFSIADVADHLAGRRTWAAVLRTAEGQARAGCRDYDGDNGEGAALALEALRAAEGAGLAAFAILVAGRAHVWVLYRRPAPAVDIAAQLAAVLPAGPGEIYPSGNNIRLPFGYHRRAFTRGALVLQSGRRFNLDDAAELAEGMAAALGLARNAAPPEAPPEARRRANNSLTPTDPAVWEGLGAERGGQLWASGRWAVLIRFHEQLATIARGGRVTLLRDGAPDNSDSVQLAALVFNAMRSHRKGRRAGDGAPPEAEIRAVALHLAPQLKKRGESDARYRWRVDYEIGRYRPEHYRPEATTSLASLAPAAPAPLPALPGRPAGQRSAHAERLAEMLATKIGQVVTRDDLARALGVKRRMLALYLDDLRAAGALDTARAGRGLRILRCAINCAEPIEQPAEGAPAEVADLAPEMCNRSEAEEAAPPVVMPQSDDAPYNGENTPPPLPPCAAPPAAPASPGRAWDLAAVVAAIGQISAELRAEVTRRVNRRTGEIVETRGRATRKAVQARLAEVPAELFAEGWEATRHSWDREFDRIAGLTPAELYAELRAQLRAIDAATRPAPAPWAELDAATRARLVDRARTRDRQAALIARARGEPPPAGMSDAAAEGLAQAAHTAAIRRHRRAVQGLKRAEALRNCLRRELLRRGLDPTPPAKERAGKRGQAPGRDAAALAAEEEQQSLWAEVDAIRARALPPEGPAAGARATFRPAPAAEGAQRARRVLPPPAAPAYDAAGLVGRLYALKQRGAAQ